MTERILAPIAGWIIAIISAGGYAGIVGLMAIESACIPLPSEIIMPFAGYLVSTGRFGLLAVATAGALGCNLGSVMAYEVGKRGGRPFVERYGRYVLLNMHDLELAERFFARWGSATVLVCRLLPFVRSFIAFPAGVARMPLGRFHLYTFVGSWPWCFALAWVGMKLGAAWRTDPRLGRVLHSADAVVIVVLAAAVAWFVWHQIAKRRVNHD
ncbi:DedA family protein [Sphingomonas nostoxanthinifaciens]|uniref:DedA family protein n=1 Tax=Sphingomonas nostoxanthinifaciens TaxID=2872652 RepID=UPI001CC1EF3D|nr:DedA family protein [Sphingomonas nostoxanthinifaciens]UAK26426.1 DedA family protein [Sphingomonas nostoxanthinifaciens]